VSLHLADDDMESAEDIDASVFFHGGNTKVSRKSSGEQFFAPDLILEGSSAVFIEVKKFATNGLHYRD